jgi:hypothetical protein
MMKQPMSPSLVSSDRSRTHPVSCCFVVVLTMLAGFALAPAADAIPKSWNGFVGGSTTVNTGGLFTGPRDVAVYTGGTTDPVDDKIFTVEEASTTNRVQRFDRSGNFELAWGKDVIRGTSVGNTGDGYEICDVAISGIAGCKGGGVGSLEGEFKRATGIAVNQATGHVYVLDTNNRRVQEFDLDGQFVSAWGWGVDDGTSAFQVCAGGCQAGVVSVDPMLNGNNGQLADVGELNASGGSIAVSPLAPHDVFVTDAGNRRVLQFESNGDFARGWGWGVDTGGAAFEVCTAVSGCQPAAAGGPENGRFATDFPRQIAADSGGVVYASDSADGHRVIRFDSDPAPPPAVLLEALPSAELLGNGQTAGLDVDPHNGNLLVLRDRSGSGIVRADVREIADPAAELVPGGPPNPTLAESHKIADEIDNATGAPMHNIAVDPSNDSVYFAINTLFNPQTATGKFTGCLGPSNSCAGLGVLAPTTGLLDAQIGAPFDVGATTASLGGVVDPGGGVARYRFQVSRDGSSWEDTDAPTYIAGTSPQSVSATLTALQPATLYRVRLLVSKQTGIVSTESIVSTEDVFLTDAKAPKATTLGSAKRTDVGVRLRGLVDPEGIATTYHFEYGPAGGSFDEHVPEPNAQAGSGNSEQLVTQDIAGLQPNTTYHYRIVAVNSVATTIGNTVTFTTKPQAPLPEPPTGRGYELVSPANKVAGVGAGIWYHGPSATGEVGFAAHEGERFAVQGTFGATLVDGKYSYANDWALAERSPDGWVSKSLATRRGHGSQLLVFIMLQTATPDLALSSWHRTTLKLFAEQESWAKEEAGDVLALHEWDTGKWEIFGPTTDTQGGGAGLTRSVAIAADGKSAVAAGALRGLAGDMDPTLDLSPSAVSVFLDDVSHGLSDTFPGSGLRSVVNVCTDGTEIPERVDLGDGDIKLGVQLCAAPAAGRSHALIGGDRGASLNDSVPGTISDDGSRVFFLSPAGGDAPCSGTALATACPTQLYVRQRSGGEIETRWISRPEVTQENGASANQDASLLGGVRFEGASTDGDKVFFRTASPMTSDDRNGQGKPPPAGGITTGAPGSDSWDLYMYDLPNGQGADPAAGDLTRITAGPHGDGDCNSGSQESSALRFMSDDGSRLYFSCSGKLEGVALSDDGTITSPDGNSSDTSKSNLYAYDATKPLAQRWRFIARLPRSSELGGCATAGARRGMPLGPLNSQDATIRVDGTLNCVRGTKDGTLITFWTDGRLTGDDPDEVTGDVYAYDAVQDELTRVSAPQGGAGGSYVCAPGTSNVRCYGDGGIGPATGGMPLPKLGIAKSSGGSGMVFFESRSRLLPADSDAAYDVYQWRDGELSLISTGTSSTDGAFFAGNDHTGQNVYLATRDRLTWQDHDAVLDIYTARVNGGIPEIVDPAEKCDPVLDQCQGGGQQPTGSKIDSDVASGNNVTAAPRVRLQLRRPSPRSRRRAARLGRLSVRIFATAPAEATLTAKVRLGGRSRNAARPSTRSLAEAGGATIALHLTKIVRQELRKGGRVRITLVAKSPTARAVTTTLVLNR